MAEQPTYKFLPEDQCLSQVQLFDYIDGKLTAAEMHAAEKHILSCGFCSDALEGLEKVKDRDKVAAFIPFAKKEDEEEKPKVIPLNPNRKYYALVAAIVLLVAVSFLMKLAFNNEPDSAKMADLTSKDSVVLKPSNTNPPAYVLADSVSPGNASGKTELTATDQQNKNSGPGDNRKVMSPPALHNAYPAPVAAEEKPAPKSGDANADGEDRDDFANIVDAEAAPDKEKDKADHYEIADKSLAKQEQSRAADYKKKSKAETKSADNAKAPALDETQQDVVVNVPPQTTISQAPASTNGASPTQATGGTTSTYTWTPTVANGSSATTSSPVPNTTVAVADSVSAGTMVSETETQNNLSYENGVKMLQAGQAAASLDMFDKVLKDPNSAHYSDAKWQKAEALIQLKRTPEAKALLNELAAKPGKYQQKAKDKLKTL